jgi:DNA-directed RNA polymerase subunit RPC12/RpoP
MQHIWYRCNKCPTIYKKIRANKEQTEENLRCSSCRSRDKTKLHQVSDRRKRQLDIVLEKVGKICKEN